MKKIIFVLLAMASIPAYAQKGTILKYGDIGLDVNNNQNNTSGTNTMKNTNFHILPGIGYQFTDHLTAGLQGGYSSDKTENTQTFYPNSIYNYNTSVTTKAHSWGVGVFGRYTKYIGKVFFLITQIDLGYIGDKTKVNNAFDPLNALPPSSVTTANGFAGDIFPGVGVFIHKGWALNFNIGGIGYDFTRGEGGNVKNNNFNFSMGRQVNLGISRNLACHMHKHHASGDDVHKHQSDDDNDD